jgi:hypothetical protein
MVAEDHHGFFGVRAHVDPVKGSKSLGPGPKEGNAGKECSKVVSYGKASDSKGQSKKKKRKAHCFDEEEEDF